MANIKYALEREASGFALALLDKHIHEVVFRASRYADLYISEQEYRAHFVAYVAASYLEDKLECPLEETKTYEQPEFR